jgi:hypothetical protein
MLKSHLPTRFLTSVSFDTRESDHAAPLFGVLSNGFAEVVGEQGRPVDPWSAGRALISRSPSATFDLAVELADDLGRS